MKSSYFTAGIVIYSRFKCVTIMSFRDRMVSNGGGGGLVKRTNCILKTSNVIILATCTGTCACTCNIFMQASWQIVDSQMFRHFYVPKNGSKNMKLARYKKESMLYISGERYIFYTLFISLAFFCI